MKNINMLFIKRSDTAIIGNNGRRHRVTAAVKWRSISYENTTFVKRITQ